MRIEIRKLGPVDSFYADVESGEFMVFCGPQASGKSTAAKAIYFCLDLRNVLEEWICDVVSGADTGESDGYGSGRERIRIAADSPRNDILKVASSKVKKNFMQMFGSSYSMDIETDLKYYYRSDVCLHIFINKNKDDGKQYISVDFGQPLVDLLVTDMPALMAGNMKIKRRFDEIHNRIGSFFGGGIEDVIYVPSGRGMLTLLSSNLEWIYGKMLDEQKFGLDLCTKRYIERVIETKSKFSVDASRMISDAMMQNDNVVCTMRDMMRQILKGHYRYVGGEERLYLEGTDHNYIKINFASSGQQEAVWLLNILFYAVLHNDNTMFIIEEPEAHLYPEAQKLITEFISISRHGRDNRVLLITHSPYVLGTLNNLLYADSIASKAGTELDGVVQKEKRIKADSMEAYFFDGEGNPSSCMGGELNLIDNAIIDGASSAINSEMDKMLEMGGDDAVAE